MALLPADGEAPGRWVRQRADAYVPVAEGSGRDTEKRTLRDEERDRERGTERDRGHWPRDWSQCKVVALLPPTSSQNCVKTGSSCYPQVVPSPGNILKCSGHPRKPPGQAGVPGNSRPHPHLQHQENPESLGDSGDLPRNGERQEQGPCWKVVKKNRN